MPDSTPTADFRPQNIEQERAKFALEKIDTAKEQIAAGQLKAKEFRSHAQSLPAMIRMNGLGQAAAFSKMKSQSDSGANYKMLYQIVSDWLTTGNRPLASRNGEDLLTRITQVDARQYRVAQIEALALMEWVRKFATAFIEDQDDSQPEASQTKEESSRA